MDINKNLAQVTSLTQENLKRMSDIVGVLISSDVHTDHFNKEYISCEDIGIGTLYINHKRESGQIEYKFVPSDELSMKIEKSISSSTNPLLKISQESLTKEFYKVYKDLL